MPGDHGSMVGDHVAEIYDRDGVLRDLPPEIADHATVVAELAIVVLDHEDAIQHMERKRWTRP